VAELVSSQHVRRLSVVRSLGVGGGVHGIYRTAALVKVRKGELRLPALIPTGEVLAIARQHELASDGTVKVLDFG